MPLQQSNTGNLNHQAKVSISMSSQNNNQNDSMHVNALVTARKCLLFSVCALCTLLITQVYFPPASINWQMDILSSAECVHILKYERQNVCVSQLMRPQQSNTNASASSRDPAVKFKRKTFFNTTLS